MSKPFFSDLKKILIAVLFFMFALGVSQLHAAPAEQTSTESTNHYQALVDMISDPVSRERLITELQHLSDQSKSAEDKPQSAEQSEQQDGPVVSFANDLAQQSESVADTVVTTITDSWQAVSSLASGENNKIDGFVSTVSRLVWVIAATLLSFILLRLLAKLIYRRADRLVAVDEGFQQLWIKASAVSVSVITHVIVVALAWSVGYGVALFLLDEVGKISTSQALFLNVFAAVELFKVVLRVVFAVRQQNLRLLPMQTETASYWNNFLNVIVNLVGYGVLFLSPLVAANLSASLGDMLTLVIVLATVTYTLAIIRSQRQSVREGLSTLAKRSDFSATEALLSLLAKSWHWLAMVYFIVMGAALLLYPEQALPVLLLATLQTVIAVFVGMGLIALLEIGFNQGVSIPFLTHTHFSTFEPRLNHFLPTLIKVVKVLIVLAVISVIFDAWGAFDLPSWVASSSGAMLLGKITAVLVILAAATVLWMLIASWIEHRLNPEESEPSAREKTLLTIFRNAIAITIILITVMIVLSEIGIDIGPLLAGAGVLGLAIGFGSQKLVQDVINGVFIQMENAINAGDVVTVGGITGVAEKLTIRSLALRDLSGTYHLIPFSSVDTVANFMREFAYHVGEYGVAYREDTDEVIVKLRDAFAELMADDEKRADILSEELEVHGVTALADSSVNIRVRIQTLPGRQWAIGREYNRLVKRHLDAAGIEIPFPHLTLYFGEDKQGNAPAMPLRMVDEVEVISDKDCADTEKNKKLADSSSKSNPTQKGDFDAGE